MNIKYTILFFFLFSCSLTAQELRISEPIDMGRAIDYHLVQQYKDSLLLYQRTRSRFFVEVYDTSFSAVRKQELIFEQNNIRPLKLITYATGFALVYYYHKRGKTHLRLRAFDPQIKQLADSEVATFDGRSSIKAQQLSLSEDKGFLVVYDVNFDGNMQLALFDLSSNQQIWQRSFVLTSTNYYKNFHQLLVNNSGEVFLIFDKNNIRRKLKKHHFFVYIFDQKSLYKTHKIPLNNLFAHDALFDYDEHNKKLVAGGLCGDNPYQAQNLFYIRSSLKKEPLVSILELSEQFMRSLTGENRKRLDGISNFGVEELILRRDGGIILVAEQLFRYEYQSVSMFMPEETESAQADFLHENVMLVSIHPDGSLHWQKPLFKSQRSENDNGRYSSFFLFKTKSTIRLLYNDDIRWGTAIYEYIVDGLGDIERNLIRKEERQGLLIEFQQGVQITGNQFVGISTRGNRIQLVRITY